MRYPKLLLASLAATLLLGALVAGASAGSLSSSTGTFSAHWNLWRYTGGFGPAECEFDLAGTFHTRGFTKTANSLIGYITSANIPRCTRGGATILRETLPWHVTYRSFAGTLPNITSQAANIIGVSMRVREPAIGETCLARSSASSPTILTFNRETATGNVWSVDASGSIPCTGAVNVTGSISGRSSSVSAGTLTLI